MNQNTEVLNLLKRRPKRGLSSWEARDAIQCIYLPARIKDLRNEGESIRSAWQTSKTGKRFKRYWLV